MAKRIPLDSVCEKKISTLPSQYEGKINYVDISSIENETKQIISTQCLSAKEAPSRAKQLLEVGDILVSTVRPNLNAVAMVRQQAENLLVGSTGYCVLRCNDKVDKRYVFYFCQSPYFVDDMTSQATGASYPAVSSGIVKNSTIPFCPIEEQVAIADNFDKLSQLIILRKQQLARLDELVKARFIELFGDLVFGDKIKTNRHKIGEIASVTKLAGFEFTKYIQYKEQGEIIMLRGLNCKKGKLVLDDVKWIDKDTSDLLPRSKLSYGDILMTYAGTIGDVAMVDADNKYHLAPNVAKITLNDKDAYNPVFLMHLFMYSNDYIMTFASQVAQASINMEKIRSFEYYFPCIDMQNEFAAFVKQTDKSKLAIQQSLDKLEILKKSLMQKYFG